MMNGLRCVTSEKVIETADDDSIRLVVLRRLRSVTDGTARVEVYAPGYGERLCEDWSEAQGLGYRVADAILAQHRSAHIAANLKAGVKELLK